MCFVGIYNLSAAKILLSLKNMHICGSDDVAVPKNKQHKRGGTSCAARRAADSPSSQPLAVQSDTQDSS